MRSRRNSSCRGKKNYSRRLKRSQSGAGGSASAVVPPAAAGGPPSFRPAGGWLLTTGWGRHRRSTRSRGPRRGDCLVEYDVDCDADHILGYDWLRWHGLAFPFCPAVLKKLSW